MKTKNFRIISQILFAALFLYLMFKMTSPLKSAIPTAFFTKLDPLLSLAAVIAGRSFYEGSLAALIVIGLTIILGRVFCGWICPMGSLLDLSDRLFFKTKKKNNHSPHKQLKYYILAGLLISAIFTTQAVYLLDPFSILTRSTIVGFFAPIQLVLKWILDLGYTLAGSSFAPVKSLGVWIGDVLGQQGFVTGSQIYMRHSMIFLAIIITIIALGSISRRYWCRNLCPLGALLGLFSKIPLICRIVDEKCVDCSKCVRECKTDAIPENPKYTRTSECIVCFDCINDCPKSASKFGFNFSKQKKYADADVNLSRRRVLQGAGIGLAFAAMSKIDPSHKRAAQAANTKISSGNLIRPPGSVEESKFVSRCIRCGNCMKACPTNGLQPSIGEAGVEGFWTPVLVPRIGYCQQHCNSCGEVCPTGAIEHFEIEEKQHLYLGTSNVDKNRCLAWGLNEICMVCAEYCSYVAIKSDIKDGVARPVVDTLKCIGCGQCEAACPVQPAAAIRVYSIGDKRYLSRNEQAEIRSLANSKENRINNNEGGGIYPGLPY